MLYVPRHARSGFSLVELMFTFVIIGLLLGGVFALYRQIDFSRKRTQTETNLKMIKGYIDIYHSEKDEYPKTLVDLKKYFERPPKDGWGNPYKYTLTPNGQHPYDLYSYGYEGPGGSKESRISVWD